MIELRTLGRLELMRSADAPADAIPLQAKRLALVAYLGASRNDVRRRDTVLALFWPELDQEHARGALRQALHSIRKALGEGAIIARGEDEIGLDPAVVATDASRLEAAIRDGRPGDALALFRGDFLEGVFVAETGQALEDWVAAERARLRALAARAAWMASERPSRDADVGELVRRAVLLSGDDESALRRGITRLEERGDRAGAAALYEEVSRRVARDLDVDLSPETQDAMRAVRTRQEPLLSIPHRPVSRPAGDPARDRAPATRSEPGGRRTLLAVASGVVLTLAFAAYFRSDRAVAPGASADRIAIMPFRVTEADSSLAWLHEGIVELLTIRIARDGGPDLADPARVVSEWRRVTSAGGQEDALPDAISAVAARLGAGRVIEGSLAGNADRVTLTARLLRLPGAGRVARASVEGPPDRLPALLDQLAAQLLGLSAGVEEVRLASLTSASLPAIQAYLRGQEAFRVGNMSRAVESFREATMLDSTFALAGLGLARATMWGGTSAEGERGIRIALAGQDRLSPADRVLLHAMAAPGGGTSALFADWNAAVTALPESPELWYMLGDHHFHWGRLAGEEDAAERAAVAFRRGWRLDSLTAPSTGRAWIPEPTQHMLSLALLVHDTTGILKLATAVLSADSTSDLAHLAMWFRAVVTSPPARLAYRENISSAGDWVLKTIHLFILWSGMETEDLEWIAREEARRLKAHDPGWTTGALTIMALNAGRPADAPRVSRAPGYAGHRTLRNQLRRAMWWDADTTAALAAEALVAPLADSAPVPGEGALPQLYDICALGTWRAARGDHQYAAAAGRRLRTARPAVGTPEDSATFSRYADLCATLLEAMHASGRQARNARALLAEADSLARENIFEVCCGEAVTDANLQLMRLWEREGDLPRALAAVRRGAGGFEMAPLYLSTFLREEGRLALLTGDTTAAIRAYRRYLALRPHPEPRLAPAVDQVRRALAELAPP